MKFLRSGSRNAGIVGLTLGEVRKVRKVVTDKMFPERYIVFYGFPHKKIIVKSKVFYADPPLIRGKAMKTATKLVRQPVIAIINAESNCITRDLVEKVVDEIEAGEYSIYVSIPYTSTELEKWYKRFAKLILEVLPDTVLPLYPSYSLVVGVRKYFDLEEETLWNFEHLAVFTASLDSKARVRIDDAGCKDQVQPVFSKMEELFAKSMLKGVIKLAVRKKAIEREQGFRILSEAGVKVQ
uniref:Uncharacterized protein n=1 Tax=Ignisphaera aggregans TaxID=334771 RepID=A0A7C4BC73_9CREN